MTSSCWKWFIVLGMVGACGGRVVVDTSGGAGGTGEAGGGGGVALSRCKDWCEVYTAQCIDMESCMAECLELASYLDPCESEYEALLLCQTAHPPLEPSDCNKHPVSCDTQLDALKACVYPAGPCDVGKCIAGSGSASDPGPAMEFNFVCCGVVYTSACGQAGSNSGFPMDCTCQIDGEPVGTCQSVTGLGVNTLGCCSAYFAESQ